MGREPLVASRLKLTVRRAVGGRVRQRTFRKRAEGGKLPLWPRLSEGRGVAMADHKPRAVAGEEHRCLGDVLCLAGQQGVSPARLIQRLAEDHVDVPFRPSLELGHSHKTCPLIHSRGLEIVTRHPDAKRAPQPRFDDHRVKERATIALAPKGLINPHLLDLRHACPSIPSRHADRAAGVVPDHKAHTPSIVTAGGCTIMLI
jgi:hypothetical protein